LGWSTNPQISQAIGAFAGTPAAKPKAHTDDYWANVYEKSGTPGAALDTGMYGGSIIRAGEAGRSINEGAGINPEVTNAGGGEQWALTNAEKGAARTRAAGGFGEEVGRTATGAASEGGRYTLERARQTDQFNLGKVGEESRALAGGSHYQVSPWLGIVQGLISGAAAGAHGPGDSSGGGLGADPNLESGGYDYGWQPGGDGGYG